MSLVVKYSKLNFRGGQFQGIRLTCSSGAGAASVAVASISSLGSLTSSLLALFAWNRCRTNFKQLRVYKGIVLACCLDANDFYKFTCLATNTSP